jgi:DedD protein
MDFLLKQRLVGAIVLVALGVIFIPMLLEGPDRTLVPEMPPLPEPEGQEFNQPLKPFSEQTQTPAQPQKEVIQAEAPHPSEGASAPTADAGAPKEPVASPAPSPQDGRGRTADKTAPEQTGAESEPAPAAPSQPAAKGPLGNWIVQMGSFSSEQNALRLRDQLRKSGFVAQVEKVMVGGKTLFRVRVGPYLERAEAERDRQAMSKTLKLDGRVLSYP